MNSSNIVTVHNNTRSQHCCDYSGSDPVHDALPSWSNGGGVEEGREEESSRHCIMGFSPGKGTFPLAS
jgi:hypothetical protein